MSLAGSAFLASMAGCGSRDRAWHDPSRHKVQFVQVEDGVNLEVLDWGGSGQPIVLLAGSGNTAHVFDDFALKLTDCCHVYGITRRGYGVSSHPDSGYSEQRLAQDILQVMDSLKITMPVLVGHSAAGGELTRLGGEHSDLLAGLVYMDAAADPTDFPASSPAYMQLFKKLPASTRKPPSPADRKSFQAYREWQMHTEGCCAFPEAELRNGFETNPDGSMGRFKTSRHIHELFGAGAQRRDYSNIRVPVLAFFTSKGKSTYEPKNHEERAAIEAFDKATAAYVNRWKKNLQNAPGGVRIINFPGANHYVFLSNETDVLRELHTFVATLH